MGGRSEQLAGEPVAEDDNGPSCLFVASFEQPAGGGRDAKCFEVRAASVDAGPQTGAAAGVNLELLALPEKELMFRCGGAAASTRTTSAAGEIRPAIRAR
jgi:hypothetical protein